MNSSAKTVIRLLLISLLFTIVPAELAISTLLFLGISYGGIMLIKLATSYDTKMKKVDKT